MALKQAWRWALAAFLPAVILRAGTIAEGDTLWQVRTGLDELASGTLMRTDQFSWTAAGTPWIQNSWAYNVADALAYRAAGLAGVALLGALLAIAIGWLTLRICRVIGAAPLVAGTVLALSSSLLIVALNARPHTVDYLCLLIGVLLLRHIDAGRHTVWALTGIGVMSVAWANLHPATPTFAVMCLAVSGLALLRNDWDAAAWCTVGAVLTMAATWFNPYHFDVVRQGLEISAQAKDYVTEWRGADLRSPAELILLVLSLIALRAYRKNGERVLAVCLLTSLTLHATAIRFVPYVLVLAIPGVALAITRSRIHQRIVRVRHALFIGAVAAALVALPALTHFGRPWPGRFPEQTTLDLIPSSCHLYNADEYGGVVLLYRPDVKVASDGRVEIHGAKYLYEVRQSLAGKGEVARLMTGAECALLPNNSALAQQLSQNPGWRHVTHDHNAALFVRASRPTLP